MRYLSLRLSRCLAAAAVCLVARAAVPGAPAGGAEASSQVSPDAGSAPAGAAAGALTLADVLASVELHFPLLERALQERREAEGLLVEAQGGFDLKLGSKAGTEQFGFYVNRSLDNYIEQPTRLFGATLYSGYRFGTGNFGPWKGNQLTLDSGEWRAGFSVPLWRDRTIDRRRADTSVARYGLDVADNGIEKARLSFYKEAARSYWDWLATGRELALSQELLKLAVERDQQIAAAVELGDLAAIERIDNQRAILERRSGVLLAGQYLEQAAIDLSLYWRSPDGSPRQPPDALLPGLFPEPENLTGETVARDLAAALERRPEIRALLAKRSQLQVETELASNQLGPNLDLATEYSRDFGSGSVTKIGNEVKASVIFELPFQRRKAQGKLTQQTAKLRQIEADLQFARERVAAEVRAAAVGVRTAHEQVALVRQEVEVARQLQLAETERFQLGDSTLFLVNLRELSAAGARLREIKALAGYHKALADYRAATTAILTVAPVRRNR